MKAKKDPDISMDSLVMQIKVKDVNHPVLRYFEHKAHIVYLGKEYDHNIIPEMSPDKIYKLEYHPYSTKYEAGLDDVLEVIVYGEEASPSNKTKYVSNSSKPNYYDIDGKIYTEQEKKENSIKFYVDQYEMKGTIRGKEAVEKYGDTKYASGVVVVRSIHK